MISVTALTAGRNLPSARFRIRQHIPALASRGYQVHEHVPRVEKFAPLPAWPDGVSVRWAPHFYPWQLMKLAARIPGVAASRRGDITWLQREMMPGRYTLERYLGRPLAFDVDDAIWLSSPEAAVAIARIARRADLVIAGNSFLANWFSDYNRNVRIIPTAIDTNRFVPAVQPSAERFVVGWTGSRSTIPYLESLEEPLAQFLARHPTAELLVIADRPPRLPRIPDARVRFTPWSAAVEADALQQMNVGLMPLPDSDWSRGKCSFKMLQYMSCGVPVIVSPVGMNAEVLALGTLGFAASTATDWLEALETLLDDPQQARLLGVNGRHVIEEHFSVARVSQQIATAFGDLLP